MPDPDSSMNLVTSFPLSSHFNVILWQIPRIILTHPSTSDEEVEPLTQGPDDDDLDSDFSDSDSHVYSDCLHSAFYTLWKIEKHTGSRYFISFYALLSFHLNLNYTNKLYHFQITDFYLFIYFWCPEIILLNKEHVVISIASACPGSGCGFIHPQT